MNDIERILIVAAEPSGDELGAEFIDALRAIKPNLEIKGVGLSRMAQRGVKSEISLDGLAILGLVEALGAWKKAVNAGEEVGKLAAQFKPQVAILIDSWGFSLRAARAIKKLSPQTKLIKMVGPQVWATRAGRAKTLAQVFDEIWCIHDFELPYYTDFDIKTHVIGNPAISRQLLGNGKDFIARHGFENKKIIGILPGSRRKEIALVAPSFLEAAKLLKAKNPDWQFITIAAGAIADQLKALKADAGFEWHIISESEKADAFAAMNIAMACSGTVTTELGLAGVPVIVGYRLDNLTYFIARNFLLKSKYVTLMNVAADKEIAQELLQDALNAENLVAAVERLAHDENARQGQIMAQNAALDKMGRGSQPSAIRAAHILLD